MCISKGEREAETVRMIFADYLSGMGKIAIVNKLQALGIPTKTNSKWMISTIHSILRDEKYTGNLILQKTYRNNHLMKIKKFNAGELPKYYVDDSHEAIIPSAVFDQVKVEISRREKVYMPQPKTPIFSEFTSRIRCGECGACFHRKVSNAGTKYATYKWVCSTYHSQGVNCCCMKPVPEDVLKQLAADVLKLDDYDPAAIRQNILNIEISRFGEVDFEMSDGLKEKRSWQYQSRRETWKRKREQVMKGR